MKSQSLNRLIDIKDHINNVENFDRWLFHFFLDTKKVVVILYVKFFPIVAASPLSPASPFSLLPSPLLPVMSKQRARDQQPQALEQPTPTSVGVRGKDSNEDEQQWLKRYSSTTGKQALGTSSPIPPSYSLNSQFFWFFARISQKEWNSSNTGIFLSLKGVCLETLPRPRSRWKITKIQRDWKCSSLWSY